MAIKDRKDREMKAREELILAEARRLFLQDGYLGLSMDKLAEAVEYSKPTLYTHFATKEDLLLAIANESLRKRVELFFRAAAFKGRSRERAVALGMADLVFSSHYREHYQVEKLIKSTSLWEKASEGRQTDHVGLEDACLGSMASVIGAGIAEGDLDPRRVHPKLLGEGMRAMAMGTHLVASFRTRTEAEMAEFLTMLCRNEMYYMDGCGWKPLWRDWDYGATVQRIFQQIFPEEAGDLPRLLRDACTPPAVP